MVDDGSMTEVESIRLSFLGCSIRMEKNEACQIVYLQLLGVRHDDAIRSGDSDLVAKSRIIWKWPGNSCGKVKSEKAQDGGEVDHFHDLKKRKVKDCGCQKGCVSNKRMNRVFLSEGSLVTGSVEEGDLQGLSASVRMTRASAD
jgi:hypothetical protein